jgi:hypothetical protein
MFGALDSKISIYIALLEGFQFGIRRPTLGPEHNLQPTLGPEHNLQPTLGPEHNLQVIYTHPCD